MSIHVASVFLVSLVWIRHPFSATIPTQEQPQDMYSAQRPHSVPWIVSKALEQDEGSLLGFECREEVARIQTAPSESSTKTYFGECSCCGSRHPLSTTGTTERSV